MSFKKKDIEKDNESSLNHFNSEDSLYQNDDTHIFDHFKDYNINNNSEEDSDTIIKLFKDW